MGASIFARYSSVGVMASCRPTCYVSTPFRACRPSSAPARPHHRSRSVSSSQSRVHRLAPIRASSEDDVVRVATVGDIVSIHYICKGPDGQVMDSSREEGEALSFEVGAGDVMGNKLFQGFDEAIRGMAIGQTTVLEATGGDWNKELLFPVPRDHPEIHRLEGRYKSHGGLKEGMIIELANNSLAVCVSIDDDKVIIDANNMMAGKQLVFELELVGIDKKSA